MIAFLCGVLAGRSTSEAYIDVNGVGWAVNMSQSSLAKLPAVGEKVRVLTHLQVREDGMALFGFLSEEEKALFGKLIGVSGVGPKVALAALSSFSPQTLVDAIAAQDVALVSKIPGVGKKTASRIILELKGSFEPDGSTLFAGQADAAPAFAADDMSAARDGLLALGFTSAEADLALKGAPSGAGEKELLQFALKKLGSLGG